MKSQDKLIKLCFSETCTNELNTIMKSPVKVLLIANLELLKNSVIYLEYSFSHCKLIGIKKDYTMPELNEFEALIGRFSKSSDILTQKVLKTLFIYLQEVAVFSAIQSIKNINLLIVKYLRELIAGKAFLV